jgi:putative Holliday junction resolvase
VRIIGLDLGEKRIGVAAADDRTGVAVPVTTVNTGDDLVSTVAGVAEEQSADEIVIGLPLSLSGAMGPQAERVLEVVDQLRGRTAIPVHTWDERLSTLQAARSAPGPRKKSARTAMAGRDAAAAAIVLQAFMDNRRSSAL